MGVTERALQNGHDVPAGRETEFEEIERETEVEFEETDVGPGDDEDDEDDEEDAQLREAYGIAPWSPIPTKLAQAYVEQHEDAAIDLVFPEVYEEDRTAKIKDLATAQALGVISHQRMSEQVAKELGQETYTYAEEMEQIKQEVATLPPEEVGIATPGETPAESPVVAQIGRSTVGLPAPGQKTVPGGGITIGAPAAGLATERPTVTNGTDVEPKGKRDDLSGTEQARFKKLQRQSEALRSLGQSWVKRQLETRSVVQRVLLREALNPVRRLTSQEVLYMEDGGPKRCDRCIMWIKDKDQCMIHRPGDVVEADMVCYLYVFGPAASSENGARAGSFVTPQISGLGPGNTTCGNCAFGNGRSNCAHPALEPFKIDNAGGCCNAWQPLGSEEALRWIARGEQAATRLKEREIPTVSVQRQHLIGLLKDPETLAEVKMLIGVHEAEKKQESPKVDVSVAPPHVSVAPSSVTVNMPGGRVVKEVIRDNDTGLITRIIEHTENEPPQDVTPKPTPGESQ